LFEEFEARQKILDDPVFSDSLPLVRDSPASQIFQLPLGLRKRTGVNAPFAGNAFLFG
jgi:hypothetical protein